jgi:MiaB/RimO family radical SAM methylthiotransferase
MWLQVMKFHVKVQKFSRGMLRVRRLMGVSGRYRSRLPNDGKGLVDFFPSSSMNGDALLPNELHPMDYGHFATGNFDVLQAQHMQTPAKFFIETYGCQMNVSDSEIVHAVLHNNGYKKVESPELADVVLVNTCSVRDKAEERVRTRLRELRAWAKQDKRNQKIAVLGCMAERLKERLLEDDKLADVVVGPDAYRDLPRLLHNSLELGQQGINVMLSVDETYADISPIREDESGVSAFISIMRGCNNMCSYCIVPFTRGRERSRDIETIVQEAQDLAARGVKDITLLGQNVNSYNFFNGPKPNVSLDPNSDKVVLSKGFKSIVKIPYGGIRFGTLLEEVAKAVPEVRIRFTSPHPKDFPDDVLRVIKDYPNVSKMIHIPAQSGSTSVLERMRRGYSRESYIELIDHIREVVPDIALSSDFISGFCGEVNDSFQFNRFNDWFTCRQKQSMKIL